MKLRVTKDNIEVMYPNYNLKFSGFEFVILADGKTWNQRSPLTAIIFYDGGGGGERNTMLS